MNWCGADVGIQGFNVKADNGKKSPVITYRIYLFTLYKNKSIIISNK